MITGSSENSIGAEAAKALATAGSPARLYLLARTESKVAPVISAIKAVNHNVDVRFIPIDFMDYSSIRRAASHLVSLTPEIDILMNFAGIFIRPGYVQSKHGVERHFATNQVGHFLLTNLLMPTILAAGKDARIVQLSSLGHIVRPYDLSNWNFHNGKTYDSWEAYSQADTSCILFARELAKRLRQKGYAVGAFSANPGFVPDSNLNNGLPPDHMAGAFAKYLEFHESVPEDIDEGLLRLEQGPATPLVAALDPQMVGCEGMFVSDCRATPWEKMEKYTQDDELAQKLWELDERLVGQKFEWYT